MSEYRPPLTDIGFVLEHVVGYPDLVEFPGFEHADIESVKELLEGAGDFMATAVAPTNRIGDTEGSRHNPDYTVTTPGPFKSAYSQYVEAGWGSVPFPEEFGGGGFPWSVGLAVQEMLGSANIAFSLCPLLTQGAIDALMHYGSDEQKQRYLPKMVSGEWTGTMNLTEPQAGSDVGALKTRAVPNGDGTFAITGQKIFITYGEHDLAEQIVHLVLARTPGAPEGTKGISCFIVPKYLVNEDGSLGERNGARCLSIEHKLGIHGSPTCVMEYDGATGYLIGEENLGMRIMFVMMNSARLSVGTEGLSIGQRAYQDAADYARTRHQGLAIGATGESSPIVDFPDVRRMVMTQKSYIAALRRLMLFNAVQIDRSTHDPDPQARARATEIVGLLTPICKSFGTDIGQEVASIGVQVHGGMGFIEETGVAQYYRDVRITPIYEGTNGIQAADLVGRKLGVRDGSSFLEFIAYMREIETDLAQAGDDYDSIRSELTKQLDALGSATDWMLRSARSNPNAVLAGSSPYLRMWGLVISGWLLARSALAAPGTEDADFAADQLVMARFFAEQLLSQAEGLLSAATSGADDFFAIPAERL